MPAGGCLRGEAALAVRAAGMPDRGSGGAPGIADPHLRKGNIMKRFTISALATALALAFGAAAVAAEIAPAPAASIDPKESADEYVDDDAVISSKVKAAIVKDSTLKATRVNVETYKGMVQLSGVSKSRADINQAVRLAQKVKGVKFVKNDMMVKGRQ